MEKIAHNFAATVSFSPSDTLRTVCYLQVAAIPPEQIFHPNQTVSSEIFKNYKQVSK